MKYAVIQDGKVVNIAIADPDVAAERGWVECPEGVGIGWSFDGAGDPLPPARNIEAEWAEVRAKRDSLLSQSDSAVLPDRWMVMEEEKKLAWAQYREALRDIPQNYDDPAEVIWPQKP